MKRFFRYAVAFTAVIVCVLGCCFSASDVVTVKEDAKIEYGSCEKHVYGNNGEYTVVGEATCSATATMYRKCVVCGYNDIFTTPKNPDNHTLVSTDWSYNPKPTCTNGGIRYKVCYDCDSIVVQEDVPADPGAHVASDKTVIVKEPTCTNEGISAPECRYCGVLFDYEAIPVKAENHVVTDNWIVTHMPTCNENGVLTGICDECGKVGDRRPIEPTGNHTPAEEWITDTEPTCTADGQKSQHCTVCDTPCNIQVLPAIPDNHSFSEEYTIDKEQTCISEGSMSKHCAYCDAKTDVYSININPDAHSYNDEWIVTKEPTCDKSGLKHQVCTLCGKDSVATMIAPVAHTYTDEYEVIKESADGLSAQVKYICTVCSYEYVTVLVYGSPDDGGDIGDGTVKYYPIIPAGNTVVKVDFETLIISNVRKEMTVAELMKKFTNSSVFAIYNADNRFISEEDLITTGSRFNYATNDNWNTDYYISVTGDLDSDGRITAADARIVLRAAAKLENLDGAYAVAADVNLDGKVLASDARKTLLVAAGLERFDNTYEY